MSSITIVCNIDLGVKQQALYACNADTNSVVPLGAFDFSALPDIIANTYANYYKKVNDTITSINIHLYGPEAILHTLSEEIATIGAETYSCNYMQIELN